MNNLEFLVFYTQRKQLDKGGMRTELGGRHGLTTGTESQQEGRQEPPEKQSRLGSLRRAQTTQRAGQLII